MFLLLTLLVQPASATVTDAVLLCASTSRPPAMDASCDCILTGVGGWYLPLSAYIPDLNAGNAVSTSGSCFDFYTVAGPTYSASNPPTANHGIVWNAAQWLANHHVAYPITTITEDIGLSSDYSLMGAELDNQLGPLELGEASCVPGVFPGDIACGTGAYSAVIISAPGTPLAAFVEDFDEDGDDDMLVTWPFGEVWLLPGPLGPGALFDPPGPPPVP